MKRKTIFLLCCLALSIGFIFSGCKKNEVLEISKKEEVKNLSIPSNVLTYLKSRGFNTDSIREFKDYYIVEGDILVSKANIQSAMSSTQKRSVIAQPGETISQAHTNNLVAGNFTNIYIAMEEFDNRWYWTLWSAINNWNSITNCRVNLIYQLAPDPNFPPDIIIKKANLGFGSFGSAETPLITGKPGGVIFVNPFTTNLNGSPRTSSQDLYMLTHEIGHTIGLKHTDIPYENHSNMGTNFISGTPASNDPNSVMNSGNVNTYNEWSSFSNYDLLATRYLYPVLPTTTFQNYINGQSAIAASSQRNHYAGAIYYNGYYNWKLYNDLNQLVYDFPNEHSFGLEWSNELISGKTYFLECELINPEASSVVYRKQLNVW